MLPTIVTFTRLETAGTPGLGRLWWSVTDDTTPPDPYTPTPARTLLVRRQRRTITVQAED